MARAMSRSMSAWPPTSPRSPARRSPAAYAQHFGIEPCLRLDTGVTGARATGDGRWALDVRDIRAPREGGGSGSAQAAQIFDRLVVANGVLCEPLLPDCPRLPEFTAAGGRLRAATAFHDAQDACGRHVLASGTGRPRAMSPWLSARSRTRLM
jgi:cation diffusion facilitator CzcD-associated flavoprotein CzcO